MNSNAKLIVIDGLDGSGKSTQLEKVFELLKQGYKDIPKTDKTETISFPDYNSDSSALVKMYLNGDFGQEVNSVNAYAASAFYAVDRYASYKTHWNKLYRECDVILAARYVSSNAMHQMIKLEPSEWDGYLEWLYDFEFNKLGLPKPDLTVYLHMPRETADELISRRYHGDMQKKDIHEKDTEYLKNCEKSALYAARKLGWEIVNCCDDNMQPDFERTTESIMDLIAKLMKK